MPLPSSTNAATVLRHLLRLADCQPPAVRMNGVYQPVHLGVRRTNGYHEFEISTSGFVSGWRTTPEMAVSKIERMMAPPKPKPDVRIGDTFEFSNQDRFRFVVIDLIGDEVEYTAARGGTVSWPDGTAVSVHDNAVYRASAESLVLNVGHWARPQPFDPMK